MIIKDSVGFEHTDFVFHDILEKMYGEYLKLPFCERNSDTFSIYSNQWCVITGRSIISPNPHRHYTLNEFVFHCGKNQDMYDYFYYLCN